jgi:DNA repair exonuclease SbcCD nuclease subunit
MRYPFLLVADTHHTSNPRDEYRWGLFPWMRDQVKRRGIKAVCFLGDLSDAKDFHPSSLVNRMAFEIRELSQLCRVYMIPGNHEWLKRGEEFWRFLSLVSDRVHYMTQPSDDPHLDPDGPIVRFLPFTKTPAADWAGMHTFEDYDYVFMHQTVKGARASNGDEMEGEDVPLEKLLTAGHVFSGDIHVPQSFAKNAQYVGSPYHVHFGDAFRPRCVLVTSKRKDEWEDLRYPTIARVTIDATDLEAVGQHADDLRQGDQVKLRMHLDRSEAHDWRRVRREAFAVLRAAGAEVHGIELVAQGAQRRARPGERRIAGSRTNREDVLRFVRGEELGGDALDAALEVIGE